MFAKVIFFCSALAAVHGSALLAAPLVNTGISVESRTQDAFGNYAYAYDIKDGATGSINSKAEVGKAVAVAAPVISTPLAYAAPAIVSPLVYGAPSLAAPVAYGGALGHAGALGLGYGVGLGHGATYGLGYGVGLGHRATYGLGYGAGILGAGYSKLLI